jgi:hypothetical protein
LRKASHSTTEEEDSDYFPTTQDEPKGRRVKAKDEPEKNIMNDGKTMVVS